MHFFRQMRRFADVHGFAIRIAPTEPGNQRFLLQLFREDIKIYGTNSAERGVFGLGIYTNSDLVPSKNTLDDTVEALKREVIQEAGVTLSRERR